LKHTINFLKVVFTTLLSSSLWFIDDASAKTTTQIPITGEWQVIRLLVAGGSKQTLRPDDPTLKERSFYFERDGFTFSNDKKKCRIDESLSKRKFLTKSLFEKSGVPSPRLIKKALDPKLLSDATILLPAQLATVYAYHCEAGAINGAGDWFAVIGNLIVWPLAPDALLLLKRPALLTTTQLHQLCQDKVAADEKIICADREMRAMKAFVDKYSQCAIIRAESNQDALTVRLENLQIRRRACLESKACIYQALDESFTEVANSIPPVEYCK
jgi:hypothetical protein